MHRSCRIAEEYSQLLLSSSDDWTKTLELITEVNVLRIDVEPRALESAVVSLASGTNQGTTENTQPAHVGKRLAAASPSKDAGTHSPLPTRHLHPCPINHTALRTHLKSRISPRRALTSSASLLRCFAASLALVPTCPDA